MAKDTFYFSHDYEPTADPKLSALLSLHGGIGYGLYWRIVEMLHSDDSHKLPHKQYLYLALAEQMKANADQVLIIITDCIETVELFKSDGDYFWSERVLRNINKRNDIKEKRQKAGFARAEKQRVAANAEQMLSNAEQNPAKERKGKERKGKERKGNKNKVFIPPTLQEVKNYFLENGYSVEAAETAFNYYQVADWHDSKGNKIKNWKQKMHGVWFKDEHKIPGRKETHAEKIRRINPYGEKFENNG
jgi:hypothetical protein